MAAQVLSPEQKGETLSRLSVLGERLNCESCTVANHEQPRDQFLHVFVWELKNIFLKMTRRGNGLAVYSLTSVYLDENS